MLKMPSCIFKHCKSCSQKQKKKMEYLFTGFRSCDVNCIDSALKIVGDFDTYHLTTKDIIDYVFKSNVSTSMSSLFICDSCLTKLKDFYLFAINFEIYTKTLNGCIDKLYYSTSQIDTEVCQSVAIKLNAEKDLNKVESCFKCFVCDSLYSTFTELVEHESNHDLIDYYDEELNTNTSNITQNSHSLCKKTDTSINKLATQLKKHGNVKNKYIKAVSCPICNLKFKNKSDFVYHLKSHKNWICNLCNIEMPNYQKMKIHKRQAHCNRIQCTICNKEMTKQYLKQHMLKHELQSKKYKCEVCNEAFTSKRSLKLHSQKHTDPAPCPKCGKMVEYGRMDRHLMYHNIREKQQHNSFPNSGFLCEFCDFKTNNTASLETHINQKHKKIKPYICAVCGKDFCGKFDLIRHMEIHLKSKQLKCEICGAIVANKKCLIKHLHRHTGERPFACNVCGDAFITISILKVHKIKKHSEKSIACPLCGYMFHLLTDMRHHFKSVHWKRRDKKFDPRDVIELPKEYYYLFEDQRRRKIRDDILELT